MERAKTPAQLKALIDEFVRRLETEIEVERVILFGEYAHGKPAFVHDVNLIVISPSFEGMAHEDRTTLLLRHGALVEPLIIAWGVSPREVADHESSRAHSVFLAQALAESREVYHGAPAAAGSASRS
jgi:hypothetical protein